MCGGGGGRVGWGGGCDPPQLYFARYITDLSNVSLKEVGCL